LLSKPVHQATYILHALPSQTVFLNVTTNSFIMANDFISDIMDYFLAGEDQQQTNQSNDQAGG